MMNGANSPELDAVLGQDPAAARNLEQTTFDRLAAPFERSLVLFGAGNLGRKTAAGLRRIGIRPLALADNNPALWGKSVAGLEVLAPDDAARRFGSSACFVVTIWTPGRERRFSHVRQQLENLGVERAVSFIPLFWKFADVFLPHVALDLPHHVIEHASGVRRAFALLEDDESRQEFLLRLRLLQSMWDFAEFPAGCGQVNYSPEGIFAIRSDEVFIDCGAFDGDSIRALLARQRAAGVATPGFDRVVAFEPDPANFERLAGFVAGLPAGTRDRITIYRRAVGDRRERRRFAAQGTNGSSADPTGDLEVETVTLDEELAAVAPTCLKLDIEGAEPEALAGARMVIRRDSPLLAVCVYHRQEHLWRLPLLIRAIQPAYRLFLRRHGDEFGDVVCYAVPDSRRIG